MKHEIEISDKFSGNNHGLRRAEKGKNIGAFAKFLSPGMKVMANNLTGPHEAQVTVVAVGSHIHTPGSGMGNYVIVTVDDGK